MMNNIDTYFMMRELERRMNDWFSDPEPKYDDVFHLLEPWKGRLKCVQKEMKQLIHDYEVCVRMRIEESE